MSFGLKFSNSQDQGGSIVYWENPDNQESLVSNCNPTTVLISLNIYFCFCKMGKVVSAPFYNYKGWDHYIKMGEYTALYNYMCFQTVTRNLRVCVSQEEEQSQFRTMYLDQRTCIGHNWRNE